MAVLPMTALLYRDSALWRPRIMAALHPWRRRTVTALCYGGYGGAALRRLRIMVAPYYDGSALWPQGSAVPAVYLN
jgi:hypothetical protein